MGTIGVVVANNIMFELCLLFLKDSFKNIWLLARFISLYRLQNQLYKFMCKPFRNILFVSVIFCDVKFNVMAV